METTTHFVMNTVTLANPLTTIPTTISTIPAVTLDHPYIIFAKEVYVWLVPVMVIVLLVSVIGNGLIVLSAPFLGRQMSPYHRLCISLAAADAWAGSLLITGLVLNSYMPVVLKIHKKNECMTAFLEIFRISGMLTSNLHILGLALNQFIGIVHPIKYKTALTTRRLRLLIFILWVVPIAFVSAWFVLIPGDGFRHPQCRQQFYNHLPFRMSVFISFIVPLLGTFILYGCIVRSLVVAKAKSAHDMRRSVRNSYRKRVKSRVKLMYTTLLILLTFVFSWGICVLYFLLVCVQGCAFIYLKTVSFHAGLVMNSTVNFLVAIKFVLNPLIYALRLDHIRLSVLNFFARVFPFLYIKRKTFGCAGDISPKSERTSMHPLALSRTTSAQSSSLKFKHLSLRRQYNGELTPPRVLLTDLVHLIENDCALKNACRADTPGQLTINEFSFCSMNSSLD